MKLERPSSVAVLRRMDQPPGMAPQNHAKVPARPGAPSTRSAIWCLEFGHSLKLGSWTLGALIPHCAFRTPHLIPLVTRHSTHVTLEEFPQNVRTAEFGSHPVSAFRFPAFPLLEFGLWYSPRSRRQIGHRCFFDFGLWTLDSGLWSGLRTCSIAISEYLLPLDLFNE